MTPLADCFAREAAALVGTEFRLHGRDPSTGLDCIGLADAALRRAGIKADAPIGYTLRNSSIARFLDHAEVSGFQPATGDPKRGDLLLVQTGPGQVHLLIAVGGDVFVHAHAGLRRVVLQQGIPDWPVLHHWRLAAE